MNCFKTPEELLHYCGITEPSEINLNGLCDVCDVTVKERTLKGCEARIIGGKNGAVVTVNEGLREVRRRFCIGHELGHWMHDRGTPTFKCTANDIGRINLSNQVEARANQYAADLLMPKKMFLKEARKFDVDFNAVGKLAKLFRTSIHATAIRLVTTGDLPAVFVCSSSDGNRKYYVSGSDIPSAIRINTKLHPDSYAVEVSRKRTPEKVSKPVPADYWVSAMYAYDYEVHEHSITGFNGDIWTLLWWKDEEMLERLM